MRPWSWNHGLVPVNANPW